jgi:von Willebrand factor type A domain
MNALLIPVVLLVALAARPADAPLRVMLLVDISGSNTRSQIFFGNPRFARAPQDLTWITEAVEGIEPALDNDEELILGAVSNVPRMTTGPVRGPSLRSTAAQLASDYGGRSPLWDALYHAAGRLEETSGARVIILLTDGRSNGNERSFAEAVERLKATGVRVFTVAREMGRRKPDPDPYERLRQLASITGGEHLTFTPGKLDEVLIRAMQVARRNPTGR